MKKILTLISLVLLTTMGFKAEASNYDKANWYVSFDVQQLRSKVVPLLPNNKNSDVQNAINNHLPTEVQQFTLYGHSEVKDDVSVLINGDLSQFQLSEYINSLMYWADPKDENVDVGLYDSSAYNNQVLEHYQVTDGKESKSFYSAKLNNQTIIISFQQQEVKNWIDNNYQGHDLSTSGMVSVLVNIESAMAHMGADLSSNSQPFNSAVFNKINQFSASAFESDGMLNIESALSTSDEATAKQLEQVLNGLIAMNALSNLDQENVLLAAALNGLQISNQGSDLLINTEFAMKLIEEMNIASQQAGYKVIVVDGD